MLPDCLGFVYSLSLLTLKKELRYRLENFSPYAEESILIIALSLFLPPPQVVGEEEGERKF